MTPNPTPELIALAAKLTPAQKKWLPTFAAEWRWQLPIGMSNKTRRGLTALGLVEELHPQKGSVGFVQFRLSDFGKQVARHLNGKG
jgi:hypothetical protein